MTNEISDIYLHTTNNQPTKIKNIIMMGDSLSDRGTMNKRLLFGFIPMNVLSELQGISPDGRFTNGLAWSDHITAQIASDFTIKRIEKRWKLNHADIADAIITGDKRILHAIHDNYSLDDDKFIRYKDKVWVRSYCEGGLMSHDYSWYLSYSIVRFFTRLILSTLNDMYNKLINYDAKNNISYKEKSETLVIEWSGANDLITVNAEPSYLEADRVVAARIDNVKKLIASGYRHFVLFNLPNLAMSPRFLAKSKEEREMANKVSIYLNEKLAEACEQLNRDYPHCETKIFDVSSKFANIFNNPSKYFFDKDKRDKPYIKSKDFDNPSDGLSPAKGYMFYDDVHPTADMHALLAAMFYKILKEIYQLLEPDKEMGARNKHLPSKALVASFIKHYEVELRADQNRFFGSWYKSSINYKETTLPEIFEHAFFENGFRTKRVMARMGWINEKDELILDEPALQEALNQVLEKHERADTITLQSE